MKEETPPQLIYKADTTKHVYVHPDIPEPHTVPGVETYFKLKNLSYEDILNAQANGYG